MPPTTKTKASPPKPTGGARAKAARTVVNESPQANTKKKRKKKKIKQKRGAVTEQALPDGTLDEWEEGEDEDDDVETEIVYACPACGLGAGTSVPMGCPYPEPCRGMMFVCRREDGGGRCGSLCWHSHPNEPPTGAVFAVTNVTATAGAKHVKGTLLACKRSNVSGQTLVSQ